MADETGLAVPTFIKERRKKLHWTQEKLAEEADLSTTAIHNLEASKNGFTDKTLASIARALGCTPAALLTDPNEAQQPIRGDTAILGFLNRIEGLSDNDIDLVYGVIRNALAAASRGEPEPSGSGDRPQPANRRREEAPSR